MKKTTDIRILNAQVIFVKSKTFDEKKHIIALVEVLHKIIEQKKQ